MKKLLLILFLLSTATSFAQDYSKELNRNWQFKKAGTADWHHAVVPGSVYTDLLRNKIIADPFYAENEKKVQWVDSCDWIYSSVFNLATFDKRRGLLLSFQGLDTYADIYVNNKKACTADNMFRYWDVDIGRLVHLGRNQLKVIFHSALNVTAGLAHKTLPLVFPGNNRVYSRKAQYQFGWDWGPTLLGCGIWKAVSLVVPYRRTKTVSGSLPFAKLIREKDSIGESFYFEKDGIPVYVKGANWIPASMFPSSVTHDDYRKLLLRAKDAHMNMLRVWGGGIYEDDYFYDLCDSLHIMVWQDFMFAGGMYPATGLFIENVKEEVKQQILRLKDHPSLVLWCGNNETDEAWHNWGWQDQYNIHGADSAKLWNDYKELFEDSLKTWVNEFDGTRPYIPSSPKYGWGHDESFKEGDSHYWGLWWGLEPWESFETHTGRFVSEYGMQSMPNYETVKTYVPAGDQNYTSPAVQWHQKAGEGFYKLNFYLDKYFIDSAKLKKLSLEEYTYLTQCLQYYILKNSITVQRSKQPYNMGTLVWQLDDCWPATSWSITDFNRAPKAGYYAVKEAYRDDKKPAKDGLYPKNEMLKEPVFTLHNIGDNLFTIESNTDAKYVYILPETPGEVMSDNYFDLVAGEKKELSVFDTHSKVKPGQTFKIASLYDIVHKP